MPHSQLQKGERNGAYPWGHSKDLGGGVSKYSELRTGLHSLVSTP